MDFDVHFLIIKELDTFYTFSKSYELFTLQEVQEYQRREAEVRQLRRKLDDAQIASENHQQELELSKTM